MRLEKNADGAEENAQDNLQEGLPEESGVQARKYNKLQVYNVAKAVLIILLIVFVTVLLSSNSESSKSVDEILQKVVPELLTAQDNGVDGTEDDVAPGRTDGAEEAGSPGVKDGQETDENSDGTSVESEETTGVFDGMGQATALDFKRIFGQNAEDYNGVGYFKPISQMDVEELLIVRLNDESQSETIEKAIDERVRKQKTSFDGYGAAQCALLDKAIIKTKGNFVFYCVSPDASKYYEKFLDAL